MWRYMEANGFSSYATLHAWSIAEAEAFWISLCEFCAIEFDTPPEKILTNASDIRTAGWFAGAKLNYARHLLRHAGSTPALIACGEKGRVAEYSRDSLRLEVAAVAGAMRAHGVVQGDRVAAILPNSNEALIAMLATASIGAIWSSCSPDFGAQGIVDRFGQIKPKLLLATNGYIYNDKCCDVRGALQAALALMPSIECVVIVPYVAELPTSIEFENCVDWNDFKVPGAKLEFVSVAFDHPLFIMFTSGTTGVPKCIVHGHGGTLLQQTKEHVLHTDVGENDTVFYFTTCGWMMWNWLAAGLGAGATLVLYDGSPFADDGHVLWEMAQREKVNVFGTSAKFIAAQQKAGLRPAEMYDLSALRCVLSTGSPLAPESFDYVYDAIGADVHLASISGGTDILSCFALGNPVLPVRRGELQCVGLGMAVEIFDPDGRSVVGEQGELVCTKPFPSAPVGFWNDDSGERYHDAYFARFDGVWAHGDFAEITPHGGVVIHGRSDAVLNPGGVRIGTAEIYRQVERLDAVVESIAIGQQWQDDVRVVLFVVLRPGLQLDDELRELIRAIIRQNTTLRHVPARILQVTDIPRTKSGKIVEIAVRAAVHDESVNNTEALANPDALDEFRDRVELQR